MRPFHPNVTSPIFELVRTIEFDITLGEDVFPLRLEVLSDTEDRNRFRCRIAEHESYDVQPTFTMDKQSSAPLHGSCSVLLLVGDNAPFLLGPEFDDFNATDTDDATRKAVAEVKATLARMLGKAAT